MTIADGLKVEAVGRVVERLLRDVAEHAAGCAAGLECEPTVLVVPLASELRAIVDAVVPTGKTPVEHAMIELGMWSAHHSKRAPCEAVTGALAAELVLQFQDVGLTREFFLEWCAQSWDSLRMARSALEAAGLSDVVMSAVAGDALDGLWGAGLEPDCGDTDCGACEGAPAASEKCLAPEGGESPESSQRA
jgi:hypothetical protein